MTIRPPNPLGAGLDVRAILAQSREPLPEHKEPTPNYLAATISTSTLNSGRVKPDTIIRVDAGGGLAT
jgi:hypothetical protein